ncbi:MAG: ABC transporter permease [Spirochaetia bacterium]|nr:ABC transporter permease [Spirochaetia bacterium]
MDQTASGIESSWLRKQFTRIRSTQEFVVFLVLVLLFIIMSLASPYFLKTQNLFNLLRNMSTIGVVGIGITMVLITGGVDLSLGSIVAVTAMFTARMLWMGIPSLVAIPAGFLLGFLLGAVNGLVIAKVGVPPFITTLGMMSIARGLTYLFATGVKGAVASNIGVTNGFILAVGGGYLGVVPNSVIEMVLLVIIFQWFLNNTTLGRQVYALGSNREAARLSGVNIVKVEVFVYTLTGGLCALAGLMYAGLLSTAATNAGVGMEMDVIAAVVIGGASLSGGKGTIIGAVIGAAIMAIIKNAFVLLHLPTFVQTITLGLVVVLAVAADNLRKD